MTFATLQTTANNNSGGNSTTHSITLPTGISSNDMLLVIFSNDGSATASVTTPATGWTELWTASGGQNRMTCWYRRADGAEASTITATTSSSESAAWTCYRYSGVHTTSNPEAGTAGGGSSSPDPPSVTASWGAEDNTFNAQVGNDSNITVTGYPTNYSEGQLTDLYNNATHGCGIGTASRQLNASSDNPGAFSYSGTDNWVYNTIVLRPAPPASFQAQFARNCNQVISNA